jgi:hypothetical protein
MTAKNSGIESLRGLVPSPAAPVDVKAAISAEVARRNRPVTTDKSVAKQPGFIRLSKKAQS